MRSIYMSDDHDLFRSEVRKFVETEVAPYAHEWEERGRIPREIFVRMGELGFLGINFAEKYGGNAADIFYSVVFLEELCRSRMGGFCAAVSVQQFMATQHIYKFGSEDLKQRYLVPSIAGRMVGALAVTEPDTGSDVAAIRTYAEKDGDSYVVHGAKTWITNGAEGDFYTVAVKTDRAAGVAGVSLIVIDSDSPGVVVGKRLKKLGFHSSDTAELFFEGVRVPASHVVGRENTGFYQIMEAFQLERLTGALMAIGSAALCLELTLEYIASRHVFGRPVNRFQAIRHRLADLASELEAARQLTYHTAWLHEHGDQAVLESSMSKLVSTELGKRIADECLQCFGGYGISEEYPMARFYRDARIGTIVAGTSEIMREIISKMMIDGVSFPRFQATDPERPAAGASKTEDVPASETVPDAATQSVADCMNALPGRFLGDKAGDWTSTFHYRVHGAPEADWTVRIARGECSVVTGAPEASDCVVDIDCDTFLKLESGAMNPQTAFMSGKVKATNLMHLMKFSQLFAQTPKGGAR